MQVQERDLIEGMAEAVRRRVDAIADRRLHDGEYWLGYHQALIDIQHNEIITEETP